MSGRAGLWEAAAHLAREGTAAAMATVSRRRGSLPMATDAKMLVTAGGDRWGTIGGGCLEADVTAQAVRALATGMPTFVRHTLNADVAGDLGLSCGGTVELFLEPVPAGAETGDLFAAIATGVAGRTAVAIATAVDWSNGPRKIALVGDERVAVGGWSREEPVPAGDGLAGAFVDEEAGLFVEHIPRDPRLVIVGAGHVGREIARVASATDFHVLVVDDREEFANAERFPGADDVVVADLRSFLDDLAIDADDYIISCTRGHAMDAVVVERTATSPARYVGMLGSQRKRAVIWKALAGAGVPEDALRRVKVPIGEPIGADTPAEIGVSVIAELIRIRRLGTEAGEQRAQ